MNVQSIIRNIRNAASVIVNGNTVSISAGDNIVISGNRIQVGSQEITADGPSITIEITGDVGSVDATGTVKVTGNVTGDIDVNSGNIEVGGDVGGDIDSSCGNVTVRGSVAGDVDCSCGNVKVGK
jgi:hypothetical protein